MAGLQTEVTRAAPDGLSGETWRFIVPAVFGSDLALHLDHYSAWTRLTERHKPQITDGRRYNRVEERWTPGWRNDCESNRTWAPPLPEDVIAEARANLAAIIRDLPVEAPSIGDAQGLAAKRRRLPA